MSNWITLLATFVAASMMAGYHRNLHPSGDQEPGTLGMSSQVPGACISSSAGQLAHMGIVIVMEETILNIFIMNDK